MLAYKTDIMILSLFNNDSYADLHGQAVVDVIILVSKSHFCGHKNDVNNNNNKIALSPKSNCSEELYLS